MRIFVCILIILSFSSYGHLSKSFRKYGLNKKNELNLELGLFHRGLIGCSYNRLLIDEKRCYLKGGGGVGIGATINGRALNQFYYLSVSSGIGGKIAGDFFYIGLGLDYKYLDYFIEEYNSSTLSYSRNHYKGLRLTPNLILSIQEENDIWVKIRSAPLYAKRNGEKKEIGWGVGLSVGKRF